MMQFLCMWSGEVPICYSRGCFEALWRNCSVDERLTIPCTAAATAGSLMPDLSISSQDASSIIYITGSHNNTAGLQSESLSLPCKLSIKDLVVLLLTACHLYSTSIE